MNTKKFKKTLKRLSNLPKKSLMTHIERWVIVAVIFLFTFPAFYADFGDGER